MYNLLEPRCFEELNNECITDIVIVRKGDEDRNTSVLPHNHNSDIIIF